jgi:[ribosomal protein S5]-alanine N-acetyltransferase
MAPPKTQSACAGQQPSTGKLVLHTPRLELIAATLPLLEAEIAGPQRLSEVVQAEVGTWPPPLNDEKSLQWTYEKLSAQPEQAGFFAWYVILAEQEQRTLVGMVGLKGPPDREGSIEAGYSVIEDFQRRGIGTEATRALIEWGFEDPRVQQVTAETFPELRPSIRVMERCGMSFLGTGSEPGTIRFGITRRQFEDSFPNFV